MTAVLLSIILAVIGGSVGIVKIAEYFQTNAEAHSDVKSLHREMADMAARLTALEVKVERLEKDNSSLIEQNLLLTKQQDELIQILQGGPEEKEED